MLRTMRSRGIADMNDKYRVCSRAKIAFFLDAQRKAAEETARLKALELEAQLAAASDKQAADRATRLKLQAEREAELVMREEEAKRKAIAEEEAQRIAKEKVEHAQMLVDEEARLRKLAEDEANRLAEEEARLRKDAEDESKRLADEEARLRKQAKYEAQRIADESARLRQLAENEVSKLVDEEARLRKEAEDEQQRLADEEARWRKQAENETQKLADEETRLREQTEREAKQLADEEARLRKQADDEATRLANEQARLQKEAEDEAKRIADEQTRLREQAEHEAEQLAAEEARLRKQVEDEAKRLADEQARAKKEKEDEANRIADEEARLREQAEREAKQLVDEEARLRKQTEDEAKRLADEQARSQKEAEDEAKRIADEETRVREQAEYEAKQLADEEARLRKQAEDEAKRLAEADEEVRLQQQAEHEATIKAAEEARKRKEAEIEAKSLAVEEARLQKEAEEEAKRKADEEVRLQQQAEHEAKIKAAEEARKRKEAEIERKRLSDEKARLQKETEEEARRKADKEVRLQQKAEHDAKIKAAEEARMRKEAEIEAKRLAEEEARLQMEADKEAQRKADEDVRFRQQAEHEAKIKAAEEARMQKHMEVEMQTSANEQTRSRKQVEHEAKKKDYEEARSRSQAEYEGQLKAAEEARSRTQVETTAKFKANEEALLRKQAENDTKMKASEEARLRTQAEYEAKRKAAEEARLRKQAEDEAARKKTLEAEAKRLKDLEEREAQRTAAAEAKRRKEAALESARRRERADEMARQAAAQEQARLKTLRAEEMRRQREAEESARRRAQAEEEAQSWEEERRHLEEEALRAEARRDSLEQQMSARSETWSMLLRKFVSTATGTFNYFGNEALPLRKALSARPHVGEDAKLNSGRARSMMELQVTHQRPDAKLVDLSKLSTHERIMMETMPSAAVQEPPLASFETTLPGSNSGLEAINSETHLPSQILYTETAPAAIGLGAAHTQPVVPPLWKPHPRSDGYYNFRPPSTASASEVESSVTTPHNDGRGAAVDDQAETMPAPKAWAVDSRSPSSVIAATRPMYQALGSGRDHSSATQPMKEEWKLHWQRELPSSDVSSGRHLEKGNLLRGDVGGMDSARHAIVASSAETQYGMRVPAASYMTDAYLKPSADAPVSGRVTEDYNFSASSEYQHERYNPALGEAAGAAATKNLVDPAIISDLCKLLRAPPTPPEELERQRLEGKSSCGSTEVPGRIYSKDQMHRRIHEDSAHSGDGNQEASWSEANWYGNAAKLSPPEIHNSPPTIDSSIGPPAWPTKNPNFEPTASSARQRHSVESDFGRVKTPPVGHQEFRPNVQGPEFSLYSSRSETSQHQFQRCLSQQPQVHASSFQIDMSSRPSSVTAAGSAGPYEYQYQPMRDTAPGNNSSRWNSYSDAGQSSARRAPSPGWKMTDSEQRESRMAPPSSLPPAMSDASSAWLASSPHRKTSDGYLAPPSMLHPTLSDASSAWSAPIQDTPFPQAVTDLPPRNASAEFGIPSLPLANLTSSSYSRAGTAENTNQNWASALNMLTEALFKRADAMGSSRSGSGTSIAPSERSWLGGRNTERSYASYSMPYRDEAPGSIHSQLDPDWNFQHGEKDGSWHGHDRGALGTKASDFTASAVGSEAFYQSGWGQPETGKDSDAIVQELLQEIERGNQVRAPTEHELDLMVSRIAASRQMSVMQADEVRGMLRSISNSLFGSTQSAPQSALVVRVAHGNARRPNAEELNQMAETIGERCGQSSVPAAQEMLKLMADILYGAEHGARNAHAALPRTITRPSPRTLDAITKRVVLRKDHEQAAKLRAMLAKLSDAMFGPTASSNSYGSAAAAATDKDQSELQTARSSVRSGSAMSEDANRELDDEVQAAMLELCGELFTKP